MSNSAFFRVVSAHTLFATFKYFLFSLLLYNLYYYWTEDLNAYQYLPDDSTFGQTFETFAVTTDYVAWMILLVLFELETGVLSEEKLKGALKWAFKGIVAVCYVFLLYAGYGYAIGLIDVYKYEPIPSETVCELVEEDYASLTKEVRFIPLDQESCVKLSAGSVFKHRTDKVVADAPTLEAAVNLGWIDVINSSAWLLVVLLFEIEVIFQSNHTLTRRRLHLIKASKAVLYLTLLGDAIYWNIYGAFIDSWDAYLWLVAFILLDFNLFNVEKKSATAPATSQS